MDAAFASRTVKIVADMVIKLQRNSRRSDSLESRVYTRRANYSYRVDSANYPTNLTV